MRQSYKNEILINDSKLIGINLGADYCAEHEWGIKRTHSSFGIDTSKFGLEKRKVTKTPSNLSWLENSKIRSFSKKKKVWSGIYFGYKEVGEQPFIPASAYGEEDLLTLWSDGEFCILASTPEKTAQLKEIYDAFASNDIAIWLGGGGVFQNSGLCIAIASHLSKEITDNWHKADVEHEQLLADVKDTGIEVKLKAAKKGYFALSPRRDSDGSLIFWLNPMEQDKNNAGWFKVSQLEEWINDQGPIPKKKK